MFERLKIRVPHWSAQFKAWQQSRVALKKENRAFQRAISECSDEYASKLAAQKKWNKVCPWISTLAILMVWGVDFMCAQGAMRMTWVSRIEHMVLALAISIATAGILFLITFIIAVIDEDYGHYFGFLITAPLVVAAGVLGFGLGSPRSLEGVILNSAYRNELLSLIGVGVGLWVNLALLSGWYSMWMNGMGIDLDNKVFLKKVETNIKTGYPLAAGIDPERLSAVLERQLLEAAIQTDIKETAPAELISNASFPMMGTEKVRRQRL